MSDFDPIAYIKEVGGVVKFGSGVLGKSAIALGVLLFGVAIAAARLHSDIAIISVVIVGAVVFFGWLVHVLKFAEEHPDITVLEGAEWSSFQRFQAAAKGYVPSPDDKKPALAPGTPDNLIPGTLSDNKELDQ
ncbi:MAG: hypothetical protein WCC04_10040 [Terriglobales bacterium]